MKRIKIRLPEMRWEIDSEYDAMAERLIGTETARVICVSSCAKEASRGAVSLLLARKPFFTSFSIMPALVADVPSPRRSASSGILAVSLPPVSVPPFPAVSMEWRSVSSE